MNPSNLLLQGLVGLGARSGALLCSNEGGARFGAILVQSGRVCWARSSNQRGRMTDLLLSHSENGLSREVLEGIVRRCRERGEPLGECLVREKLVSHSAMRTALLRHTCEAIRDILAVPVPPPVGWSWVEHRGMGYSTALTFSPAEVFSGVHALDSPGVVAALTTRLQALLRRGQLGFVLSNDPDDLTPHAQVACDVLPVDVLAEIVPHARELMSLGSLSSARGIVATTETFAYAVWEENSYLHVIVDGDEHGFNWLVSQLAAIQT